MKAVVGHKIARHCLLIDDYIKIKAIALS